MTGADLEGFADAAWWLSKLPESLDDPQGGVRGLRRRGRTTRRRLAWPRGSRSSTSSASEPSVGGGFLMRAQRHAAELPPGREHGFLAMLEATVARFTGDLEGALARIRGRRPDRPRGGRPRADRDGDPHAGARADRHAAASARASRCWTRRWPRSWPARSGPYFTGIIYCSLIGGVPRDRRPAARRRVERRGAWPGAPRSRRTRRIPAMCRANRAEVARLRGAWAEAEAEASSRATEPAGRRAAVRGGGVPPARRDPAPPRRPRRRRGRLHAGARARRGSAARSRAAPARAGQGRGRAGPAIDAALAAESRPPPRARLLAAQGRDRARRTATIDDARAAAAELGGIAEETRRRPSPRRRPRPPGRSRSRPATSTAALRPAPRGVHRAGRTCGCRTRRRAPGCGLARALPPRGDEEGRPLELRAALAVFEGLGAARDAGEVAGLLADARRAAGRAHGRGRPRSCAWSRRARRTATSRWSS